MSVMLMIIIFLLAFLVVNLLMSNLGILPELARKYDSPTHNYKSVENSLVNELEFSRDEVVNIKDPEYRGWLKVAALDDGLLIAQRPVLNLFPRKALIPWPSIKHCENNSKSLKKRYMYTVSMDDKTITMISKKDLMLGLTD